MNLWWVCVLAGFILIGIEVLVPGFTVIWFGIAALVTAVPVALGARSWVTLTVFGLSLLLLATLGRKVFQNSLLRRERCANTNAGAVVGKIGIVVEKIDAVHGTGRVRVDTETWTATSRGGETIPAQAKVRVEALSGARVVVSEEATES